MKVRSYELEGVYWVELEQRVAGHDADLPSDQLVAFAFTTAAARDAFYEDQRRHKNQAAAVVARQHGPGLHLVEPAEWRGAPGRYKAQRAAWRARAVPQIQRRYSGSSGLSVGAVLRLFMLAILLAAALLYLDERWRSAGGGARPRAKLSWWERQEEARLRQLQAEAERRIWWEQFRRDLGAPLRRGLAPRERFEALVRFWTLHPVVAAVISAIIWLSRDLFFLWALLPPAQAAWLRRMVWGAVLPLKLLASALLSAALAALLALAAAAGRILSTLAGALGVTAEVAAQAAGDACASAAAGAWELLTAPVAGAAVAGRAAAHGAQAALTPAATAAAGAGRAAGGGMVWLVEAATLPYRLAWGGVQQALAAAAEWLRAQAAAPAQHGQQQQQQQRGEVAEQHLEGTERGEQQQAAAQQEQQQQQGERLEGRQAGEEVAQQQQAGQEQQQQDLAPQMQQAAGGEPALQPSEAQQLQEQQVQEEAEERQAGAQPALQQGEQAASSRQRHQQQQQQHAERQEGAEQPPTPRRQQGVEQPPLSPSQGSGAGPPPAAAQEQQQQQPIALEEAPPPAQRGAAPAPAVQQQQQQGGEQQQQEQQQDEAQQQAQQQAQQAHAEAWHQLSLAVEQHEALRAQLAGRLRRLLEDYCECPITTDLFSDPVVAADGQSYERTAILDWLQRDAVSPVTRQPLPSALLFPNLRLRGLTEDLHALLRLVEGRQPPGGSRAAGA